jgi:site-specific DNA recombinase
MTTAAVYCRVSTDSQEAEGTSLQTQLEACRNYCHDRGYEVAYRFSEAYSGLTLERPKLNELRELVRNEQVDIVVVYYLDRLSRDPTHGVILTQELEKHGVKLEAVTETVDSTELGKLITYIRGFASKLEAEKIKERTGRGKRARAKEGKVTGGFHNTYGYDYIQVAQKNGGRRIINESESRWVKQIYQWLINDGLTSGTIRDKLIAANAPTKHGKRWCKATVIAILKNPCYAGRTYAFTCIRGKPRSKPQADWIELSSDITPAIITPELFEAAQKQLQANRDKAMRNTRREYLLRGHIRCRQCNHAYVGDITRSGKVDGSYKRLYRCLGRWKDYAPTERCHNKAWGADKLEALVWQQIEGVLANPEIIATELEKQRQDADQLGVFETELQQVERQLKSLDREQEQLLQWALKGFPESQVIAENKRLNTRRESLKAQEAELEAQIKASQEAVISIPKLERFVELLRQRLTTLGFETKRMAIESLDLKVWLDGDSVEITGIIPTEADVIVTTQTRGLTPP